MIIDYRVCIAQQGRITFVNGRWQGTRPSEEAGALQTCPEIHDYLCAAGQIGWELITVVGRSRSRAEDQAALDRLLLGPGESDPGWHTWDTLYLKKPLI
jgi:hypothetical protein